MAIQNRRHVMGLRDVIHGAVQGFADDESIGPGGIAGADLVVAISMVLRDAIKQCPDAYQRAALAAGARVAIDDAGKASILLPGLH